MDLFKNILYHFKKNAIKYRIMNKVLVLNSDYTPINVTTAFRGFILVTKGKAEILKSAETPIITDTDIYERPVIIRLLNYVKYRIKSIRFNRQRLFCRDGHKCCYCGNTKNLTIDHVIPKSKGGKNSWDNLAITSSKINRLKNDMTIDEFVSKHGYSPKYKLKNPRPMTAHLLIKALNPDWAIFLDKIK